MVVLLLQRLHVLAGGLRVVARQGCPRPFALRPPAPAVPPAAVGARMLPAQTPLWLIPLLPSFLPCLNTQHTLTEPTNLLMARA